MNVVTLLLILALGLCALAAFGVPANGKVHLGWLGAAVALFALILPSLH